MNIVYLDLGTHVAAAWNDGTKYHVAKWVLEGARATKLMWFARWFRKWLDAHPDYDVAFERPFCRGQAATRFLWGMAAHIESIAEAAGRACVDANLMTVKKFITGSGKAEKEDMIAAVRDFGYTGNDEHEADALAGLLYVEATIVRGEQ